METDSKLVSISETPELPGELNIQWTTEALGLEDLLAPNLPQNEALDKISAALSLLAYGKSRAQGLIRDNENTIIRIMIIRENASACQTAQQFLLKNSGQNISLVNMKETPRAGLQEKALNLLKKSGGER